MKRVARKDDNHNEIVDALKLHGVSVIDTSSMGGGFPDLICGFAGKTLLMEIKNPKTYYGRKGLNKNQARWKDAWIGGPYAVVDSAAAAIRAVEALKGGPVAALTDVEGALRLVATLRGAA